MRVHENESYTDYRHSVNILYYTVSEDTTALKKSILSQFLTMFILPIITMTVEKKKLFELAKLMCVN